MHNPPDGYTTSLPSVVQDDSRAFPVLAEVSQPLSPMVVAMQGHWQWAQRMQLWPECMTDQDEVVRFGRLIENLFDMVSDCKDYNGHARTLSCQ